MNQARSPPGDRYEITSDPEDLECNDLYNWRLGYESEDFMDVFYSPC